MSCQLHCSATTLRKRTRTSWRRRRPLGLTRTPLMRWLPLAVWTPMPGPQTTTWRGGTKSQKTAQKPQRNCQPSSSVTILTPRTVGRWRRRRPWGWMRILWMRWLPLAPWMRTLGPWIMLRAGTRMLRTAPTQLRSQQTIPRKQRRQPCRRTTSRALVLMKRHSTRLLPLAKQRQMLAQWRWMVGIRKQRMCWRRNQAPTRGSPRAPGAVRRSPSSHRSAERAPRAARRSLSSGRATQRAQRSSCLKLTRGQGGPSACLEATVERPSEHCQWRGPGLR
mmetsp:Transcript_21529/g.59836  ORF Transcript_21529/g.59836 Transcript_21529/m.59836 type:complete len:278 (-) Transcript_21529:270-1103(-)